MVRRVMDWAGNVVERVLVVLAPEGGVTVMPG
jgi:hypothetical protein